MNIKVKYNGSKKSFYFDNFEDLMLDDNYDSIIFLLVFK